MYTNYRFNPILRAPSLVLNYNVIADDIRESIIKGMGLAACQVRCIRCSQCSACKCGKGGGHTQ